MSTTTAKASEEGGTGDVMEVNTIALIVGLTVVATILLIVCLTAVIIGCRNYFKKRKKDRSRLYMVHNGASPFSSVNSPPSGGIPSYSSAPHAWGSSSSYFVPTGYENKAVDVGEFRPNPLAENPYYPQQQRPYVVSIPNQYPHHPTEYSGDLHRYHNAPYLAESSRSFSQETQSLHQTLYAKLIDTVHERNGRPVYLCKRENYNDLFSNYFDVVGKSKDGDLLVKPRPNIPNRPKKKAGKKHKAPIMSSSNNHINHNNYDSDQQPNGYIRKAPSGPGGGAMITTPFGAAERIPSHYLSGAHIDRANNNLFEQQPYTSLPRDGKLHVQNTNSRLVKRQISLGAADKEISRQRKRQQQELDEQMYAQVMKKNALNGGVLQAQTGPNRPHRTWDPNLTRRPISTIEEVPKTSVKTADTDNLPEGGHRERSGSASTSKSLGITITDQFKFLEQYDTEEERF